MENQYLRICLLFFFVFIYSFVQGQHLTKDNQWLILNGVGKNGVDATTDQNYYDPTINTMPPISLSGIAYPRITDPDTQRNYYNRFLAIFTDGNYAFIDCPYNGNPPDHHIGNGYNLSSPTISHLYLTNVYEEDDPPERVVVGGTSTTMVNVSLPISADAPLKINHNPAEGDDMTIIVGKNQTPQTCRLGYSLIDTATGQEIASYAGFTLNASRFNADGNAFGGSTGSYTYFDKGFDASTRELTLEVGSFNTFLNFEVDFDQPEFVGNRFNLKLSCRNTEYELEESGNYLVSSGPKDPNYVKLECVWEEDKKCRILPFIKKKRKYAKYKVYCYNESTTGDVDELKFTFYLPQSAVGGTVLVESDSIFGEYRCPAPSEALDQQGLEVEYEFGNGLNFFPGPGDLLQHFGTFTFCVRLKNNTDLYTADLRLVNPLSHFDLDQYPISNFIDVGRKCIWKGKRDPKNKRDGKWYCKRNEKICSCSCRHLPGTAADRPKKPEKRKVLKRTP